MSLFSDELGQASIEVLLMIAAAIVVALVVALYLKSVPKAVQNELATREQQVLNG